MAATESAGKLPLIGCGILAREIRFLIEKNAWEVEPHFLSSSLHIDFQKLERALTGVLFRRGTGPKAVVYGTCHPRMDHFVQEGNAVRSEGQNCIEILLGREEFHRLLSEGIFFLMEDWALRWKEVMSDAFGDKPDTIREIFTGEHSCILCLRTPCSGDFSREAQAIGGSLHLPVHWYDVSLEHLEKVLMAAITGAEAHDG